MNNQTLKWQRGESHLEWNGKFIATPRLRGSGINYGILNDFNTLLKPQMIVPAP